ncbi:MAG: DegT/DnrJ/EryC1/StrS family aminotransferase [Oligoflexales bacterium]
MRIPFANVLKLRPVIEIDLRWRDFVSALFCIIRPKHTEQPWPQPGSQTCFSVRSGFNQLLSTLELPHGSEVILGPITIPDMVSIISANGLTPKFVDLDPKTYGPCANMIEASLNENVKAILVTQLFGRHFSLEPIAQKIKDQDIFLIEDCAQAFDGNYKGSSFANACIFSFGPIKKHTALGGGKVFVREESIGKHLEASLKKLPRVSEIWFLKQIFKYAFLKILSSPPFYGFLNQLAKNMKIEPDKLLYKLSRSFGGAELNQKLKFQLPEGANAFLNKRLSLLIEQQDLFNKKPWVKIVQTPNRQLFVRECHKKGISASVQLGSIRCLSPKGACPNAEDILQSIAFQ